jgi:hypothetical protein
MTKLGCRPADAFGQRVTPSDFETYRLVHSILGPCCLCPFQYRGRVGNFKEAAVFMAVRGRHAGQYVAACADDRCGYFGDWINLRAVFCN